MVRELKKEDRVFTNTELTNAVKNILCMIEYIHGALIYNYKSIEGLDVLYKQMKQELERIKRSL